MAGTRLLPTIWPRKHLLRPIERFASFKQQANFKTWLYRIAYNSFVDFQRKRPPGEEFEIDKAVVSDPTEAIESSDTYTAKSIQQDIAKAMLNLSTAERGAIHLSLYKQHSHQEISDIMGVPHGTVKTHILRGREKLKKQLTHWQPQERKP